MVNQDVPDQTEVSNEGLRIIEFFRDDLVRLSVLEPIREQVGDALYVKADKRL
jgi:hypothetical protein